MGQGQADGKRLKLEHPCSISDPLADFLANFDFSALPVGLVADLVIANLQLLPEQSLNNAIEVIIRRLPFIVSNMKKKTFRQSHTRATPMVVPATTPVAPTVQATAHPALSIVSTPSIPSVPTVPPLIIKEEPIDPLQMDMDEDDIEYEPDRLNDQLEVSGYTSSRCDILICMILGSRSLSSDKCRSTGTTPRTRQFPTASSATTFRL
jgi:symplekin